VSCCLSFAQLTRTHVLPSTEPLPFNLADSAQATLESNVEQSMVTSALPSTFSGHLRCMDPQVAARLAYSAVENGNPPMGSRLRRAQEYMGIDFE
jgi:hypothetical protein